jgi:hypothetical protein
LPLPVMSIRRTSSPHVPVPSVAGALGSSPGMRFPSSNGMQGAGKSDACSDAATITWGGVLGFATLSRHGQVRFGCWAAFVAYLADETAAEVTRTAVAGRHEVR